MKGDKMKKPLEEVAVKEAKVFLKTVSEGLKILAKGVENLARHVDTLSGDEPPESAAEKRPKKKAAKTKKASETAGSKSPTGGEIILGLIERSKKKGVSISVLIEKTGFDNKKVNNILYRLKKQKKIKNKAKGVYVKG